MYDTSKLSQPAQPFKPGKFKKIDWVNVLLVVVCLLSFAVMGCATMMDHVSPCAIDPMVTDYVDANIPTFWGFTTLYHAKHVALRVEIKHRTQQLIYTRMLQDDDLSYDDARAYAKTAIAEGQAFQEVVVGSEESPFSLMGMLAAGAPALMLGRAMKRKQDYTPDDVKKLAKDVEKRTEDRIRKEIYAEQAAAVKEGPDA